MSDELDGPDLTAGLALADIADGAMVKGHAHGEAARGFAQKLAALARTADKPLVVAIDAGPAYEEYRAAFAAENVPTFDRVENALLGLRAL